MNKKIIIVSGDSFAAGDELGADFLIPGYTSIVYNVQQPSKVTPLPFELFLKLSDIINARGILVRNEYRKKCLELAWPAQLQKITGIEVLNVACGGISNHEICHRLQTAYFTKIKEGYLPEDITVFVMITSPFRIGFPQRELHWGGPDNYQSFSGHYPTKEIFPKSREGAITDWFKSHNDWEMLWSSFSQIEATKQLLSKSKFYIFTSGLFENFIKASSFNDVEAEKADAVTNRMDIFLDFGKFVMQNCPNTKLSGGHYNVEAHIKFAEQITKDF